VAIRFQASPPGSPYLADAMVRWTKGHLAGLTLGGFQVWAGGTVTFPQDVMDASPVVAAGLLTDLILAAWLQQDL